MAELSICQQIKSLEDYKTVYPEVIKHDCVLTVPTMSTKSKHSLVYQVENDILRHSRLTKLSFRKDASYFTGRAGLIRIINLVLALFSIMFLFTDYKPRKLIPENEDDAETIELLRLSDGNFEGYGHSKFTLVSVALGGCTALISIIFLVLLYLFMEVRCDLLWEKVNQKAHVLACVLSVGAAFCDLLSIQDVQNANCKSAKCEADKHNVKVSKYEEAFYPPSFMYHYVSFVCFLINAMLYSIASRIWLRNDD